MPLWDVKARYVMRGGAKGETEDVHQVYLEAATAEAAIESAARRGIASEAGEAARRPGTVYVDLIAVAPVYYVYDAEQDFVVSTSDPEDALGEAVEAALARALYPGATIEIGNDDGPEERVAEVWPASDPDLGVMLHVIAPAYAPPAWRVRTATETQVSGELVTIRPVPEWFAREEGRTFREQMMASPVKPTEPAPTVPYVDLEAAQRARFAGLELDDRRRGDDPGVEDESAARFRQIELNPPRVHRAQRIVAKLDKATSVSFAHGSVLRQPSDVVAGLVDYIGRDAHEVFIVIYINVRNKVIGYTEFTSGDVAGVEVHVAGILRNALAVSAAAIITVHQHPTGDPEPSEADRALWRRVRAAAELVGVPVLDNMVLGDQEFFSEEQKGLERIPPATLREAQARGSAQRAP